MSRFHEECPINPGAGCQTELSIIGLLGTCLFCNPHHFRETVSSFRPLLYIPKNFESHKFEGRNAMEIQKYLPNTWKYEVLEMDDEWWTIQTSIRLSTSQCNFTPGTNVMALLKIKRHKYIYGAIFFLKKVYSVFFGCLWASLVCLPTGAWRAKQSPAARRPSSISASMSNRMHRNGQSFAPLQGCFVSNVFKCFARGWDFFVFGGSSFLPPPLCTTVCVISRPPNPSTASMHLPRDSYVHFSPIVSTIFVNRWISGIFLSHWFPNIVNLRDFFWPLRASKRWARTTSPLHRSWWIFYSWSYERISAFFINRDTCFFELTLFLTFQFPFFFFLLCWDLVILWFMFGHSRIRRTGGGCLPVGKFAFFQLVLQAKINLYP